MSQKSKQRLVYVVPPTTGLGNQTTWQPAADIYRTRSGWLLKFELAGVTRDDITLEVHRSHLKVSGVRRDLLVDEYCSFYSLEIAYNRFERTVELPCDLEKAAIEFEFRNGILLVRVTTEGGQP
jgi:HSP20 family protein